MHELFVLCFISLAADHCKLPAALANSYTHSRGACRSHTVALSLESALYSQSFSTVLLEFQNCGFYSFARTLGCNISPSQLPVPTVKPPPKLSAKHKTFSPKNIFQPNKKLHALSLSPCSTFACTADHRKTLSATLTHSHANRNNWWRSRTPTAWTWHEASSLDRIW